MDTKRGERKQNEPNCHTIQLTLPAERSGRINRNATVCNSEPDKHSDMRRRRKTQRPIHRLQHAQEEGRPPKAPKNISFQMFT